LKLHFFLNVIIYILLNKDAAGWFKLAICYFIFYVFLASFFVLMLVIFYQIVDPKKPTYYNKESVMNYKIVNPGLGFRPQLNPESEMIRVNLEKLPENLKSLEIFLEKYEKDKLTDVQIEARRVQYNYENLINDTPCSRNNKFGLDSLSPCVIVKLNKIFGWKPKPINKTAVSEELGLDAELLTDNAVFISCRGEGGVDRDNIKEIEYYSLISKKQIGGIPFRYFPYKNQDNYLSPLVFVHFKNISSNTLINVECKAYAQNIDNKDRANQRGMVRFQLFVDKKP